MRVLIVDDSAFIRAVLRRIIDADPDFEVVGTAGNGVQGLEAARALQPDVITLDVEMPVMDGLTMLRRLMAERPIPVVMVSSLTGEGTAATVAALAAGAVDVVTKPSGPRSPDVHRTREDLLGKLRTAVRARPRLSERLSVRTAARPAPAAPPPGDRPRGSSPARHILIVGSSTGGPSALQELLAEFPADLPAAIVVVQHMPPGFTASLAQHLDRACALPVREAEAGDRIQAGRVLVAPGGRHLEFGPGGRILLVDGPPRHGVRPSVDVTLDSAAHFRPDAVTIAILTGMGVDGAQGAYRLARRGATVLAQDEASSVVDGMPRAVRELGIVRRVGAPWELGRFYLQHVARSRT